MCCPQWFQLPTDGEEDILLLRMRASALQKTAGGLIGLVIAMLLESVLLIIRTSEYGKGKKKKRKGHTISSSQQTGASEVPIASSGVSEPKKDR